jgi:hypothetical protein
MNTVLTVLLCLLAAVVVGLWVYRQARRLILWLNDWLSPRGVVFSVRDIPLTDAEWQQFGGMAVGRRKPQAVLLADIIRRALEDERNRK